AYQFDKDILQGGLRNVQRERCHLNRVQVADQRGNQLLRALAGEADLMVFDRHGTLFRDPLAQSLLHRVRATSLPKCKVMTSPPILALSWAGEPCRMILP